MRSRTHGVHSSLRQKLKLLSEAELLNYCTVALDISLLEIAEKVSSVANQRLKTSAAVVVLMIGLEVLGESLDSVSQKSNLNLGRTGIALVSSVHLNNCLLFVFLHHGSFHLSFYLSKTQLTVGEMPHEATVDPKTELTTCVTIIPHTSRFVNRFLKINWNFFGICHLFLY